jgi:hypothetical protein
LAKEIFEYHNRGVEPESDKLIQHNKDNQEKEVFDSGKPETNSPDGTGDASNKKVRQT